jgi:hypothetical protein
MDFNEFMVKIASIKNAGYVKSHRTGDTGIGKTLEDLLGIQENNIVGPDFGNYELKSGRIDSSSMLTLFTKAPQPFGANGRLLEVFGYPDNVPKVDRELHVTVESTRINSVGLRLVVEGNKVFIKNSKGVKAYYAEDYLRRAFEQKYRHPLVYVLAKRLRKEGAEWFWFNEVQLLSGFDFQKFSNAIRDGVVKVDLRMGHYNDGRPHDHGTGFRVLPRNLSKCFANIKKLI